MLRLAQTQIGIGSRDLTWHTERHRSRQKLRENGYPIEVFGSPVKVRPGSAGKSRPSFAYGFPRPPSAEKVVRKDGFAQKDAVISNAPILQSLRTDWDNVVDDAGSPSGILIEHVGKRHQAIQRSRVSRETARSFSASVEDNDFTEEYISNADSSPRKSPVSSGSGNSSDLSEENDEVTKYDDELTKRVAYLNLPRLRSRPVPNSKKLGNHSCLDGCLDSGADCHLNGQKNTSEKIELSFEGMTSSLIATPFAETEQEDQSSFLSPEPNVLVPSPELPITRPADIIRHRSGGLPRSSLYISQAATPSPPEKLPQMLPESGFYTKTSASLEKRIKSQSYSSDEDFSEFPGLPIQSFCCHEESKLIPDSLVLDPTDLSHESSDTNLSARIGLPYSSAQISLESSRSCCQNHHQSSALPSPNPHGSSPISSNQGLNPRAAEFVSNLTDSDSLSEHILRQSPTSPTAPIPPYPFSATPRTISYNLAFPASPASFQSDSSQQSYVHSSPSPTQVRLPVYNDRLPASTQPQTPAHIPNIRLHARSSLNPFGPRMAQTAPPVRAQARSAWWRDLTMQTPTRGSRRGHLALNEEQENLEVTVEVERLLEQRRMRGNERQDLARTPE